MVDFKEIRVFDTSVHMDDSACVAESIKENCLVKVPWVVHRQLTGLKKDRNKGHQASRAIKEMAPLSAHPLFDFANPNWQGINGYRPANILSERDSDDTIIATALSLKKDPCFSDKKVVLYTHDLGMKLKAEKIKLNGEPALEVREWQFVDLKNKDMLFVCCDKQILEAKNTFSIFIKDCDVACQLFNNEGVLLSYDGVNISKVGRVWGDKIYLLPEKISLFGVSQKPISEGYKANWQQVFALNMLTNLNINYFVFLGVAGSGKTLLALASAFEYIKKQKNNGRVFKNIYITRTIVGVGDNDLGFMPGGLEKKWVLGLVALWIILPSCKG